MFNQNFNFMKKQFLFFGCLALPLVGYAQGSSTHLDSIQHLDEVLVQAQRNIPLASTSKIPAPQREIPVSMTAITRGQLQEFNLNNLVQATKHVPNMRSMHTYGAFQRFYMRGFSNVVVLNDGMRDDRHAWYSSAPSTSLASVERIEVIRGASSMTVGHNALGGVINVIRRKPTEATRVNARASYGSWGTYQLEAGAGGRITEGLTFRTDFGTGYSEGWRHTQDRFVNGHLSLNYKVNPRNELSLMLLANEDMYKGDPGRPHMPADIYDAQTNKLLYKRGDAPLGGDRRTHYGDPIDHLGHKNLTTSLKWQSKLGGSWELTEYASYFHDDVRYFQTEDLMYQESSTPTKYYKIGQNNEKVYMDLDKVKRGYFAFDYQTKILQNQLELTGKITSGQTQHNLLFGYALTYTDMPRFQGLKLTGAGKDAFVSVDRPILNQGNLDPQYTGQRIQSELLNGLYVQDYMRWGKLAALAGLRLDVYNRSFQMAKTDDKTILSKGDVFRTNYLAFTYRLGLLYDISKELNVYASVSNFFKPTRTQPQDNRIYLDSRGNEIKPGNSDIFAPESAIQYEAGARLQLGRMLEANLAGFYIIKENMVANLGKKDNKNVSGQIGRASSMGAELDLTFKPTKSLEFMGAYGLTIAKSEKYAFENSDYANKLAGKFLDRIPMHTANLWSFYSRPLGAESKFRLGLGVEYSDKVYADASNQFVFPAYTLLNALVSYQYSHWKIQLNANNLTDQEYYVTSVNTTGYIPSPGRGFTCSVSYEF